jgi:hypothetical protein
MGESAAVRFSLGPLGDPLLKRGWQHDGRDPVNPEDPGVVPQKIPSY